MSHSLKTDLICDTISCPFVAFLDIHVLSLLPRKGENCFAQNRAKSSLPPPRDSACSRPTPSSHIHFRRQGRRVGCALQRALRRARCGAKQGRGGGGEFTSRTTLLPSSLPRTSLQTDQEGEELRRRKERRRSLKHDLLMLQKVVTMDV